MNVKDKIVFVTGGANGIGRALCERFAAEEAKRIVVADLDYENAQAVADAIGGVAVRLDVSDEAQVKTAVEQVLGEFGHIDLVCSNAGIGGAEGCLEVSNDVWQKIYEINVLSHLYLSRACFPSMLKRGSGYFLVTASPCRTFNASDHRAVCRQQTRGGRVCRMAFDCLRRARNKNFVSVSARRENGDDWKRGRQAGELFDGGSDYGGSLRRRGGQRFGKREVFDFAAPGSRRIYREQSGKLRPLAAFAAQDSPVGYGRIKRNFF